MLVGEGDTALPQPNSQARASGALGFSHYFFQEVGGEVITTLVEGPAGEQVRSNLSYLQLKQIYDRGDPPPQELGMTIEELGVLVGQLDTVRQSTEKYKDVDVALADGYVISREQFPNMGAHFVNPERAFDGVFNPAEPEFLLYIQDEAEEWELVGTGFLLPTTLAGRTTPTASLARWTTGTSITVYAWTATPTADRQRRRSAGSREAGGSLHLAG